MFDNMSAIANRIIVLYLANIWTSS